MVLVHPRHQIPLQGVAFELFPWPFELPLLVARFLHHQFQNLFEQALPMSFFEKVVVCCQDYLATEKPSVKHVRVLTGLSRL